MKDRLVRQVGFTDMSAVLAHLQNWRFRRCEFKETTSGALLLDWVLRLMQSASLLAAWGIGNVYTAEFLRIRV